MLSDEFEKTSAMKIQKSKINIGKSLQTGAKKVGQGVLATGEAIGSFGSTVGAVSLLGLTALTNSIRDATVNARNKKK